MSSAPFRLVIVGGGITGLSAARAAVLRARELARPVHVTVLESSDRFGGHVTSARQDGFLVDAGPDSWVASKPQATSLARELGLGSELVGTREDTRGYFVAWGNRLHRVPEGLVLGIPTRLRPLALSGLFSWSGKARMAVEPWVARRVFAGDEDESIQDFATRRLGQEAADRLVAPLLGGISAGDASELSIRAAFPQLVAMEREHGSLVAGMRALARTRRAGAERSRHGSSPGRAGTADVPSRSAFVSLAGGVGELPRALMRWLVDAGVALRPRTAAEEVERCDVRFGVAIAGERLQADAVLLAVPAYASARLVGALDRAASEALASIAFGSTATVFLAYRRPDVHHPLDGVGFVVPRSTARPILASTWVSSKWRERAPEGHALLRVFFGGAWGEDVLGQSDDALTTLARRELASLMKVEAEPLWSRTFRFQRGTAQMRVGHLALMRQVRERLAAVSPAVRIAGGGYDGVGIPDCVRQGEDAGRALVEMAGG